MKIRKHMIFSGEVQGLDSGIGLLYMHRNSD